MVRTIRVVVHGSETKIPPTQHTEAQRPCEYVEKASQRYGLSPTMDENSMARMNETTSFYSP